MNETDFKDTLALLRALPIRPDVTWQGGWVPVNAFQREFDPDDDLVFALWLDASCDRSGPANANAFAPHETDPQLVGAAFIVFALEPGDQAYLPGVIEVSDMDEILILDSLLTDLAVEVRAAPGPPEVMPLMRAHIAGKRRRFPADRAAALRPSLAEAPDLTFEQIEAFAAAARRFHFTRPWLALDGDDDPVRVTAPEPPGPGFEYFSVLGSAGEVWGLGFHPSYEAFAAMVNEDPAHDDPGHPPGPRVMVTFERDLEIPPADLALWDEHQLPLAGHLAYPTVLISEGAGRLRGPDPDELAYLTLILDAVAGADDDDLDRGCWTFPAGTPGHVVDVTLELPDLLEPISHAEQIARGIRPDPRAAERLQLYMSHRIAELGQSGENAGLERIQAVLADEVTGVDYLTLPITPQDDWERAQLLCWDAFAAVGRRRVALAGQALAITDACTDACLIIAEHESNHDPLDRLVWYERAVEAGLDHVDPDDLAANEGDLWPVLRARPYLRALSGVIREAYGVGILDSQLEACETLLGHDRGDSQRIRLYYVMGLLDADRNEDALAQARRLVTEASDDALAHWLLALATFRIHGGDDPAARSALAAAVRVNRHVRDWLEQGGCTRRLHTSGAPPGDRGAALITACAIERVWMATAGATEWLVSKRSLARRDPGKAKGRARPKTRKRRGW